MSYCFDVIERAWSTIRPSVPNEELAIRFEQALMELHEANHRLKDQVNHDGAVRKAASRLDECLTKLAQERA